MWTPMPMRSDSAFGEPNPHHVPPPGTVAHRISERLRMNQPSSSGTRPTSVSSIFASCMGAGPYLRLGRHVPRARRRIAVLEAVQPRRAPLLGRAVVLGVAVVEVARGGRRAHGLLDVAGLELALAVDRVAPQAGHAVGLQLERLGAEARALGVQTELLLDVVGVLVRDDVREAEVADRVAISRALAREVVRDPAPQARREHDGDVHRVVGRALERGAVVGGHAAPRAQDVAGLDPHVRDPRLAAARRLERPRPVAVDAPQHLEQVPLDPCRLRSPAARRRPRLRRRLRDGLAQVVEDLLDALLEALARLLGPLAEVAY